MSVFDKPKSNIHLIARGLLIQGESAILCRMVGADWYFLPGGHIENGETAKDALLRELKEEIAEAEYVIGNFMGVRENIFELSEGVMQQEVNLVFEVDVPVSLEIKTKEGHIEFVRVLLRDLANTNLKPDGIGNDLANWLTSKSVFYK